MPARFRPPARRASTARRAFGVSAIAVLVSATLFGGVSGPASAATAEVTPSFPTGNVYYMNPTNRATNTTGVTGVLAWDTTNWPGSGAASAGAVQHNHVTTPVHYAMYPPVGGPHNAIWMNAGVYTKPVPIERAVHNLEHGAVWITYRPNVSADVIAALDSFVDKQTMISEGNRGPGGTPQANRFIDMSPWPSVNIPAPIVISSWGYQLQVTDPTDPRIQQFVNTFRRSKYSPERYAPVDGVSIKIGGNPATDGSLAPNPA